MIMANNTSQGIYSPLPQSISDSDSEKELQMDPIRPSFSSDCQIHNGNFEPANFCHNGCALPTHHYEERLKVKKLSPARKCCFIFSICLCFLTVFVFLWGLPCSDKGMCPVKISSWETQHEGIELKGKINVVGGVFENNNNLAILFTKNLNVPGSSNGLISILGNNGGVAWYISQVRTSTNLNCSLIDVNGDGILDCLLLGELGLEAVDPVSGTIFWHVHGAHKDEQVNNVKFPIVLPDFDGDMINELLTTSNWNGLENKLIIICGKTGNILGSYVLEQCSEIYMIEIIGNNVIYSCKNNTDFGFYQITLVELRNILFIKNNHVKMMKSNYIPFTDNGNVLGKKRLIIKNKGNCPECRANIKLFDSATNKEVLSWSYSNTYAMKPEKFTFKSTKASMLSLKGHVNGFILKLWQWSAYRTRRRNYEDGYKISKRHIPSSNGTIQVNSITERVILITFNDTNEHVINASLTEITQLCFLINSTFMCQPDKFNQENSLLIFDLDNDGSQELISYSTTYIHHDSIDTPKEDWQLISNIKVIRLEAELPKLYEVAK